MHKDCYTHGSGGDPGALGLPPSIFIGLRNSSYGTASVPRAISWGKEGAPLVRGEGFLVTATSRGRPSSGMSPPEPGRRAARRLFILRYLTKHETQHVQEMLGGVKMVLFLHQYQFLLKEENATWWHLSGLTSPVLPESEQRCSWLREDSLPSASCHDTYMSCTCCVEEAKRETSITKTENIYPCIPFN